MRRLILLVVGFVLTACVASQTPVQRSIPIPDTTSETITEMDWKPGETVELTGTIWPSRAHTKYYIDTEDGKSAHLKSIDIDKLEAGTKLFLTGTVEYVNSVGTAGASRVRHAQTYFYVNVREHKILDDSE